MSTLMEIEKLAAGLPERDRALLAVHLLRSLPAVLQDQDDGVSEALERDADIAAGRAGLIALGQLDDHIRSRRN